MMLRAGGTRLRPAPCRIRSMCGVVDGWNPGRLPGTPREWLAGPDWCFTDTAGTVPAGDTDAVAAWVDRWQGTLATQTDPLKRPTLRMLNGKWNVLFDGVNDEMNLNGGSGSPAFGAAYRLTSDVSPSGIFIPFSPLSGIENALVNESGYTDVSFIFGGNGTTSGFDAPSALTTGAWHTLVASYAGGGVSTPSNYTASFDGVVQSVTASGPFGGGALGTIGTRSAFFAPIRVASYTLGSQHFTASESASLSSYLAGLY